MAAYRFNIDNFTAARFETKQDAGRMGNDLPIFDSMESLAEHKSIPTSAIMTLFNSLTGANVKKFADRKTAARRLWVVLEEAPIAPAQTVQETTAPEEAPKPKTSAKRSSTAGSTKRSPKTEGSEAANRGRKAGTGEFAGKTIFALKEVNPRRSGTFGFKSYEILQGKPEGVAYTDYLAAGGRPQDLRWDIARKWAEVK